MFKTDRHIKTMHPGSRVHAVFSWEEEQSRLAQQDAAAKQRAYEEELRAYNTNTYEHFVGIAKDLQGVRATSIRGLKRKFLEGLETLSMEDIMKADAEGQEKIFAIFDNLNEKVEKMKENSCFVY